MFDNFRVSKANTGGPLQYGKVVFISLLLFVQDAFVSYYLIENNLIIPAS